MAGNLPYPPGSNTLLHNNHQLVLTDVGIVRTGGPLDRQAIKISDVPRFFAGGFGAINVLYHPLRVIEHTINIRQVLPAHFTKDAVAATDTAGNTINRYSLAMESGNDWLNYVNIGQPELFGIAANPNPAPFLPVGQGGLNSANSFNDSKLIASIVCTYIWGAAFRVNAPPAGFPAPVVRHPPVFRRQYPNGWNASDFMLHRIINNTVASLNPYPLEVFNTNHRVSVWLIPDPEFQDGPDGNEQLHAMRTASVALNQARGLRLLFWYIVQLCERIFNIYPNPGGGIGFFLMRIRIQVIPIPAGGCHPKKVRPKGSLLELEPGCWGRFFQASSNNCLLKVLRHAREMETGKKTKVEHADGTLNERTSDEYRFIRHTAGLVWGTAISPEQTQELDTVAEVMRVQFVIENTNGESLYTSKPVSGALCSATVILHQDHYYLKDVGKAEMKKCGLCARMYRNHHVCNNKRARYMRMNHPDMLEDQKIYSEFNPDEEFQTYGLDYKKDTDYLMFDFETFPFGEEREHIPYAVGWWFRGDYHEEFGLNCTSKFIEFLQTVEPRTFTTSKGHKKPIQVICMAWNGAKYDFKLIIRHILNIPVDDATVRIDRLLISNNRVLTFCLNRKKNGKFEDIAGVRFLDPVCFITSSLNAACRAFKIDADSSKSMFPHALIKCSTDLDKLVTLEELNKSSSYLGKDRQRICEDPYTQLDVVDYGVDGKISLHLLCKRYLYLDVISMTKIVTVFFNQLRDTLKINPENCITISQLSNICWNRSCKFKHLINVCQSEKEYDFIKAAVYGGRCYPTKREFYSTQFNVVKFFKQHEDTLLTHDVEISDHSLKFDQVTDCLHAVDYNSLYPSAMQHFDFPTGDIEWCSPERLHECQDNLNQGEKLAFGIFRCYFQPNKYLMQPILPKHSSSGMTWDLYNGEGTYTNVDLNRARLYGYKITLLEGYEWADSAKVFEDYIHLCMKIKKDGQDEGNPVKRSVGKLIGNGLYGKMLQKLLKELVQLCYSEDEVQKFCRDNIWQQTMFLTNKVVAMIGEKAEFEYRKPYHLGAFILAYSRELMDIEWRKLNPHAVQAQHGDATTMQKAIKDETYYMDTDSLYVRHDQLDRVQLGTQLMMLKDEATTKDSGKILLAYFIGKKQYAYLCLTQSNKLKVCLHCKGITNELLTLNDFWKVYTEPWESKLVYKDSIKTHSLQSAHNAFQVKTLEMKRTFKCNFQSRVFVDENLQPSPYETLSLPLGHHLLQEYEIESEKEYGHTLSAWRDENTPLN